jgi:hypothetical protein
MAPFNIMLARPRHGKADDLGGVGRDAGCSLWRQDLSDRDGRLVGGAAHSILNHDSHFSARAD